MDQKRDDAAELIVEIPESPQYLSVLKGSLKVGALVVPKTKSFSLLSHVNVRLEPIGSPIQIHLVAELIFDTGTELGLQILEIKEEERKILVDFLNHRIQPRVKPFPPPVSAPAHLLHIPKEGFLSLHFPADMQRIHHGGEAFLGEDSIFTLLEHLEKDQWSGRLLLEGDDRAKTTLSLQKGRIVSADREPLLEENSLSYLLRKAKRLSESDYLEIHRKKREPGQNEFKLLQSRVSENDIRVIAATFINQIFDQVVTSRNLHYRLKEGEGATQEGVRLALNMKKAIFRAMLEAAGGYRSDELWVGLEGHLNHYAVRVKPLPMEITELQLKGDELRFWEVTLAEPKRLRDLIAVSALSKMKSLDMIYALYFLGMIDFVSHIQPDESKIISHLKQLVDEISHMNAFDRLQVHWTALRPAILETAARRDKEWNAFVLPTAKRAEALPLIAQIKKYQEEASALLADDRRRQELRNKIVEPHKRQFTAELFIDNTKSYLFRGERREAEIYAQMAVDLCPENSEYLQLLQSCRVKGAS